MRATWGNDRFWDLLQAVGSARVALEQRIKDRERDLVDEANKHRATWWGRVMYRKPFSGRVFDYSQAEMTVHFMKCDLRELEDTEERVRKARAHGANSLTLNDDELDLLVRMINRI